VEAVEASSGRHLLATVPGWVLLIGAAGLEIVLALLGWSLGHGRQEAPAVLPVAQPVTTSDTTATASESIPPVPSAVDADDDGKKLIHVSADELKLLQRASQAWLSRGVTMSSFAGQGRRSPRPFAFPWQVSPRFPWLPAP